MTDDVIESAAKKVIHYKGFPWSETEYNAEYYETLKYLKEKGANEKQIEKFKGMVDSAPIRGGRFNRYGGD